MADIQAVSNNLMLGQDGIWYSKDSHDISYPPDGNSVCFSIEDRSFWFKHRNNCILSAMKSYPPEDNGTLFDIGGGNGFVSLALAASGFDVVLVEPGRTGALNAKRRGLPTVVCASTDTAEFKPHSLSAIGLFDVLEHIEDDLSFLKSLRGLIKEKGTLYITVPAYSFLWSGEDVAAGHYRRYTRNNLCKLIEHAGFEVKYFSYIFRLLPIPVTLFRVLPYRIGLTSSKNKFESAASDHAVHGGIIANVFHFFLKSEIANIKNNRTMSYGGSCLVVAKST